MLKKLLAMAAASVMMLSCFGGAVQAEYEYAWGGVVTSEVASTTGAYDDDTTTAKRFLMNGGENQTAYWYVFDDGVRSGKWFRCYSSLGNNTSGNNTNIFELRGNVIRINPGDYAGNTFYSTGTNNYARLGIGDQNATTGANLSTDSSKLTATTMTYEFDIQFTKNFFGVDGYVSTKFAGSDTGTNIYAFRVDANGKIYSTPRYFTDDDMVELGQLKLGKKHKLSFVVTLTPREDQTNAYWYELTVYIDGVKEYNATGLNSVEASRAEFIGFVMDYRPWTISTSFDYTTLKNDDGTYPIYAEYGSNKPTINQNVKEYNLIDTDTTISDFYVYAGNKYAQDAPSIADSAKEFHITSNVRNNTNYVTVAADAGTATAAKAILATYSGEKLVNVTTKSLTLSEDAITETDIELTNEGATTKKLFILDSLGNIKPLAADTVLD